MEPQVFETDDAAYNCGRLLAVLEAAQKKAHEFKLQGAGVVERFYASASTMPARVFPNLIKLNLHHLRKIDKSEKYKTHEPFLRDQIQEILALFTKPGNSGAPEFPPQLNLHEQGRFALGFYQQKAKDDAEATEHIAAKKRDAAAAKRNEEPNKQPSQLQGEQP